MADYDYLSVSDGNGDAALMHVEAERLTGSSIIEVDTVTNVPAKFIGTYGTLGANGLITSVSKRDFNGHVSGSNLVIDSFAAGSTDDGNAEGDVVIIKPNTPWSNLVGGFVQNLKNIGTALEDVWVNALTATSAAISGALTVGGNTTLSGNLVVNGTSRVASTSITTGSSITPSSQIYNVTALAVAATINAPSFAAADGMSMVIRIKDNGTARALTFAADYTNVSGLDTPTTTVAGKELTIGAMYNSAATKWEIQGINQSA